ncbi:hypothetical protein LTR84_004571 [Exophiala bonariae]|uniref:Aminoglycoside phosphotransferase domain-containing protein n=1 Tax=Exophiala bonariae TaxID=1690606 RepID=A0AAV9NN22_9EURO|nr:hypothetical protein LTR84_004571 [Exophiala bonariae]
MFDFIAYLERLDPSYAYQVEQLTGGVINFTVRASKVTLTESPVVLEATPGAGNGLDVHFGRFPGHGSLILKHAASHIAEMGEGAHIPQTRQLVEATALALFLDETRKPGIDSSSLPGARLGCLHTFLDGTGIMTPEILHYDASDHVLILSDLGALPDLSNVFCELGGYTPGSDNGRPEVPLPPPKSPRVGQRLTDNEVTFFENLGTKLGRFFARLHSQRVHQAILDPASGQHTSLTVGDEICGFPLLPQMKTVVHEHVIKPLRSQLRLFPSLIGIEEADTLFSAIEADFLRDTGEQERCFVIGDCWTGTILVDLDRPEGETKVGVIDWEFANISGRGINGDISQFTAHLELFLIAASSWGGDGAPGHISPLKEIMQALIATYEAERAQVDDSTLKETITRSAFLSHGAELINCAFWKIWICKDSECLACRRQNEISSAEGLSEDPDGSQRPSHASQATEQADAPEQCTLIAKMVSRGLAFLRCAVAEDLIKATISLRQCEIVDGLQPSLVDLFT